MRFLFYLKQRKFVKNLVVVSCEKERNFFFELETGIPRQTVKKKKKKLKKNEKSEKEEKILNEPKQQHITTTTTTSRDNTTLPDTLINSVSFESNWESGMVI